MQTATQGHQACLEAALGFAFADRLAVHTLLSRDGQDPSSQRPQVHAVDAHASAPGDHGGSPMENSTIAVFPDMWGSTSGSEQPSLSSRSSDRRSAMPAFSIKSNRDPPLSSLLASLCSRSHYTSSRYNPSLLFPTACSPESGSDSSSSAHSSTVTCATPADQNASRPPHLDARSTKCNREPLG